MTFAAELDDLASGDFDESVLAGLRQKLNDAVVDELVQLFGQTVRERLVELAASCKAGDRERVAAALHSIKGSAQLVGALRLGTLAAEGEARARTGDLKAPDRLLRKVTEAFETVARDLDV